ncbi:MAG: hypothetical protein IT385_15900 [Deltaproteobacteria bacterium]|nr:hypothetical protein [Deltaproteobacteria bacterium]
MLTRSIAVLALASAAHLGCSTGAATQPCPTPPGPRAEAPAGRPPEARFFEVEALETWFEGELPDVREEATIVRITAPEFFARARVRCDNQAGEGWAVGFVQAVIGREQVNEYPDVRTLWELRPLPINDSDGTYPWYSASARVYDCRGAQVVHFSDAPSTSVSWLEARPAGAPDSPPRGLLKRHRRAQQFRVWLVALHVPTDRVIVLSELDWSLAQTITFDATRPVGSRLVDRTADLPDVIVRDGADASAVPEEVMRPPRANDADQLWWSPNDPALGPRTRIKAPQWGPR